MAKTEQVLQVFLASPSDVSYERDRVDGFVSEWNSLWSDEIGIHLKLVRWETNAFPAVGADGQDVINGQIGDDYDVFIGIMWKRFGTPTARAASGTVEEFERALARYRKSGQPALMFYFKKIVSDDDLGDATQLQAVKLFRDKVAKEGLLYWEFSEPEQFSQFVRVHLTRQVQAWAKKYIDRNKPSQPPQADLKDRYQHYLEKIKTQSLVLPGIINRFAQTHMAYLNQQRRRRDEAQAMTDETPDMVWKMSLLAWANEMIHYADEAEAFEASYIDAFSEFIEGVLGAAAVSIAFPSADIKPLNKKLGDLRRKLLPVYGTVDRYIDQLEKATPKLSGAMQTSNQRIIEAHKKFREHVKFGTRLLLEAEKLFNAKKRH